MFGEKSNVGESKTSSVGEGWREKVGRTGVGVGGGGGVAVGQVDQKIVGDTGHMLVFEKVGESADVLSEYVGRQVGRWKERNEAFQKEWVQKSQREKSMIDQRWIDNVDPNGGSKKTKL
jgi:hypothetical protein